MQDFAAAPGIGNGAARMNRLRLRFHGAEVGTDLPWGWLQAGEVRRWLRAVRRGRQIRRDRGLGEAMLSGPVFPSWPGLRSTGHSATIPLVCAGCPGWMLDAVHGLAQRWLWNGEAMSSSPWGGIFGKGDEDVATPFPVSAMSAAEKPLPPALGSCGLGLVGEGFRDAIAEAVGDGGLVAIGAEGVLGVLEGSHLA